MIVRCLIVDDNEEFLRAARDLLEREGISIVGVASNSAQARRQSRELKPDVALIDIDLGQENGFDLARQLADVEGPEPPRVIFISTHSGDDFAEMIAESPALEFLPKPALSGPAIRDILARAANNSA
jgi:CheY-like chemotaxis protein